MHKQAVVMLCVKFEHRCKPRRLQVQKEVHNLCLGDRRLLRGEISQLRPEGSEELVQQSEKRSKQSDQFVMPGSERAFIHSSSIHSTSTFPACTLCPALF